MPSVMSDVVTNLPPQVHILPAEAERGGWQTVAQRIDPDAGGEAERGALWFAVCPPLPATLMWLRVYRKSLPEIFECKPVPSAPQGQP